MNNTLTIASFTNTSSSTTMHLRSRTEEIAICSAIVIEAVLIAGENSLTIFLFALEKKLRTKSLLLVINMAFADVMLGAVVVALVHLLANRFSATTMEKRCFGPAGGVFPLDRSHFLAGVLNFCSVYIL